MSSVHGEGLRTIDGVEYYVVPNVDRLEPFLVGVVSSGDLWLYASSSGGIAAGRVNAEGSLFPYRTDDLLHLVHGFSGGFTGIRREETIWEPFTGRVGPRITRSLARSTAGDRLLIIETNDELGIEATASWRFSERSGIVRTVRIRDLAGPGGTRTLEILDGIRELVAGGAGVGAMQSMSCLINAYTRAEIVDGLPMATVTMESSLSDRAEPAESLLSTVAWGTGLSGSTTVLEAAGAEAFLRGDVPPAGARVVDRAAAFLRHARIELPAGGSIGWSTVADVRATQAQVAAIRDRIAGGGDLDAELEAEIASGSREMDAISAQTDGLQCSGESIVDAHHRTNTLYNDMRGGIPFDEDRLPWGDWVDFCRIRQPRVLDRHADWFAARSATDISTASVLVRETASFHDPDLERLALEYLPFWFGRRHGDPSRPWNRFNIHVRDDEGHRLLSYEGNWRDIFQNWEALALSHPTWLDRMIAKFVNATTSEGFNPYRITREGIDWEVPEPDNPFSNLGYWGDHQIVYLSRLLESLSGIDPRRIDDWMDRPIFSSADVPYRLVDHEEMLADPRRSIHFDRDAHEACMRRVEELGSDGRLLHDDDGVVHSTFGEKLLIPVLAKLCSFVPDGGVWMNTQRPEWNDANNALAGFGLSMVTTCQLRRHLALLRDLYRRSDRNIAFSKATADWFRSTEDVLRNEKSLLGRDRLEDSDRGRILDALGRAFESRRKAVFGRPETTVGTAAIADFCDLAIEWLDHAIEANFREDGLFHGYNLLAIESDGIGIRRLPEMLEGQVAVLSAGLLTAERAADLLETAFDSALHRTDLNTFLLQPAKEIPSILDKGVVPPETLEDLPLLRRLVESKDRRLVEADDSNVVRFASSLVNGRDVVSVLDLMSSDPLLASDVARDRSGIIERYDSIFDHHAFTGRSGGMYGYEGIGCTYWHMVAKLLVAVGECVFEAERRDEPREVVDRLRSLYGRVRDGLGFRMDATRFGALPIDAYSHSDGRGRAKQPGMTGQVKEELITRRMELGVRVEPEGIRFAPTLLPESEWTTAEVAWPRLDFNGGVGGEITIPVGGIGFQCLGVPVIMHRGGEPIGIEAHMVDGSTIRLDGDRLDRSLSDRLLARDRTILHIRVNIPG
ncbi:MAG: hypothetical protein GY895_21890 [Phycisphaera sp.]|nr:hypothetical protein [Phycisphaera sp.]